MNKYLRFISDEYVYKFCDQCSKYHIEYIIYNHRGDKYLHKVAQNHDSGGDSSFERKGFSVLEEEDYIKLLLQSKVIEPSTEIYV